MPLDLRYHAITLVAVFCALFIGIMVGALVVGDPAGLQKMVAELKADNQRVREQHSRQFAQLRADYDALLATSRWAWPVLVRERLRYRRVALVFLQEEARQELEKGLRTALAETGALVTSSSTLLPAFFELDTELAGRIAERLQLFPPPGKSFAGVLAARLARRLAEGEGKLPEYLQSAGLLRYQAGAEPTLRVGTVLLVGGLPQVHPDALDAVLEPMLAEWKGMGLTVLGCESRRARPSAVTSFGSWDISSVDNVDDPPGRLALVLVIENTPKRPQHFGVKDTADRLLPAPVESGSP